MRELLILYSEVTKSGEFNDGTSHWRIQNQLSHIVLALVATTLLVRANFDAILAFFAILIVFFVWEFARLTARSRSQVAKSLVDMLFYVLGAAFAAFSSFDFSVVLCAFGAVLLFCWALLPSIPRRDE